MRELVNFFKSLNKSTFVKQIASRLRLLTRTEILTRQIARRTKIHHVYYMLAAFDLLAVGGGLYLSHRLNELYVNSVQVNQDWASHIKQLSVLGEHAQATNAPGNDIFDSRDVPTERARQIEALTQFNAQLATVKSSFGSKAGHGNDAAHSDLSLVGAIAKIGTTMDGMVDEANLIFQHFEQNKPEKAAERMASMDRKYGDLSKAVNAATSIIQDLQAKHLDDQLALAGDIRRYEYMIGSFILLMVGFVAVFGHRIAMTLKKAHEETAQKAAELKEMNESVTNLNVELANNIIKLKEAQDDAVRKGKLAQLGQLTATVAHEIRNPLGAIRTSTQLVERKVKGKDLGLEKSLERINNGVTRCDHIITELLDFARSKMLQVKTIPLNSWLRATIEEEAKALPPEVNFTFDLGLGDTNASIDIDRMRRVFINLVSNASEAMVGKGNVKPIANIENPNIHVTSKMVDNTIEITVKDNGPGIAEENIKKILEPLFTTKSFGVGLGLPAVDKILEQHGGGLKIESKVGDGATFTAWFPREQAQAKAA